MGVGLDRQVALGHRYTLAPHGQDHAHRQWKGSLGRDLGSSAGFALRDLEGQAVRGNGLSVHLQSHARQGDRGEGVVQRKGKAFGVGLKAALDEELAQDELGNRHLYMVVPWATLWPTGR